MVLFLVSKLFLKTEGKQASVSVSHALSKQRKLETTFAFGSTEESNAAFNKI